MDEKHGQKLEKLHMKLVFERHRLGCDHPDWQKLSKLIDKVYFEILQHRMAVGGATQLKPLLTVH